MLYTGRFINLSDDIIEVNITTNNSTDSSTELEFAGDSPVIITQSSQDGIFTPVKSRSCTITVVTHDAYYDMYSGESHGTLVTVDNISKNSRLFYGYMTPCEYNQPLLYLNEIELEAVDALSTLHDFKYEYQNHSSPKLVSINSIIKYCFNVAGYTGGVYMQKDALQSKKGWSYKCYPGEMEFISEEIFIDDDDAMTCYEVLEEIGNFYNFTFSPIGNDVYIIDYEIVSHYWSFSSDNNEKKYLKFKNLINGYERNVLVPKTISVESYAGDDQNVELDEVYNKVELTAETIALETDDVVYDPMEDVGSTSYLGTFETGATRSDGQNWTTVTRIFEYIKGSYFPELNTAKTWQTLHNVNSELQTQTTSYKLTGNFTNTQLDSTNAKREHPYGDIGYIFNKIPAQTCLPAQQFSYQSSKEMPYSSSWSEYMMFFPQAEWIYCWLHDNQIPRPSGWKTQSYWLNTFYNDHMGGSKPVLKYWGKKDIEFSPADIGTTNYIAITGDLLFQQDCTYDKVNYHLWVEDKDKRYFGGILSPIHDLGANGTHTCNGCSRRPGSSGYNTGWDMLKLKIKIGDKCWNGSSWTTTDSICWIPYHKENVVSDEEKLIWSDFNKPVTNHNYTYAIGKDAFVIPITKNDGLFGKVYIEVYMPRIPWSENIFDANSGYLNLNYHATPPVILMKNFTMELVSSSTDHEHWYVDFSKEDNEENEIKYSNNVVGNNVKDFDDLTLKINTFNDKVKNSQSYVIEPLQYNGNPSDITSVISANYHTEGFRRPYKNTVERQEMNVINRYVEHHSTPKKIYNCTVHDYYEPYRCAIVDAIPGTYFVVDEQEYDVKNNVNSLKIVQY